MTNRLEQEIKEIIVTSLALEDVEPDDIDPVAPLFDAGLSLDSIDALELGVALQKRYGVTFPADAEAARQHFKSVQTLAAFIATQQKAS